MPITLTVSIYKARIFFPDERHVGCKSFRDHWPKKLGTNSVKLKMVASGRFRRDEESVRQALAVLRIGLGKANKTRMEISEPIQMSDS